MLTKDAIAHYGSVAALAKALGIARVAPYQWGEYPPVRRQYELERLTEGALKVEESTTHG